MQVTFTPSTPLKLPSTVSAYDTTTGTKAISTTTPRFLTNINPAAGQVLQCAIRSPETGQYYTSQGKPGTNGSDTPYQTTVLSRCDSTGNLLDSMTLNNAGHGTSFSLEYVNGTMYIWLTYNQGTNLGPNPTWDLVRFPWTPGTYNRNTVPGLTMMPKLDSGYSLVAFDIAKDNVVVRTSAGSAETYRLRRLSEMRAGINRVYGTITTQQLPPTVQGFTTVNNTFFRYIGAANADPDPTFIEQYSWVTGKRIDRAAYPTLGAALDGKFPGGKEEPESCTVYRNPTTGKASLIFGITFGVYPSHSWALYTIDDIGE